MIRIKQIDLDPDEQLAGIVLCTDLETHTRAAEILRHAPATYPSASDGVLITLTTEDLRILARHFRTHSRSDHDEDLSQRVTAVLHMFRKDLL